MWCDLATAPVRARHLVRIGALELGDVLARARLTGERSYERFHLDPGCALVECGRPRPAGRRDLAWAARPARGNLACHVCDEVFSVADPARHALLGDRSLAQVEGLDLVASWSARAASALTRPGPLTRHGRTVRAGVRLLLAGQAPLLPPVPVTGPAARLLADTVADQTNQLNTLAAQGRDLAGVLERVWVAFGGPVLPASGRVPDAEAEELLAALGAAGGVPHPVRVEDTEVWLARIRTESYRRLADTTGRTTAWAQLLTGADVAVEDLADALRLLGALPGNGPLRRTPVLDATEVTRLTTALAAARG